MIGEVRGRLPLQNIKVVEFAHYIAAPSAGQVLADLGADVVKVERPTGDSLRHLGTDQAMFRSWNGGKRSIALDLASRGGKEVALSLALEADVVIESFRRGTMEKLGLGFDDVRRENPGVIYASLTGFGAQGPNASRRGVDAVMQAETGIMQTTGEAGGRPLKVGFQLVDTAAGMFLGTSILASLLARNVDGVGDKIELSLFDVGIYMQAHQFTEFSMSGTEPQRLGNTVLYGYPTDRFATLDGAVQLAAYAVHHWPKFCEVLGRKDLVNDSRFVTNAVRIENSGILFEIVQAVMRDDTTKAWLNRLWDAGIMAGSVATYEDVLHGEEATACATFDWVERDTDKRYATVRYPNRHMRFEPKTRAEAPAVGKDTLEVLRELGFEEPEDLAAGEGPWA